MHGYLYTRTDAKSDVHIYKHYENTPASMLYWAVISDRESGVESGVSHTALKKKSAKKNSFLLRAELLGELSDSCQ